MNESICPCKGCICKYYRAGTCFCTLVQLYRHPFNVKSKGKEPPTYLNVTVQGCQKVGVQKLNALDNCIPHGLRPMNGTRRLACFKQWYGVIKEAPSCARAA
jgi:hypothetical protein